MKPAETIPVQTWMRNEETRSVMDALGEGQALFVGGCVRNAMLGEAVEDIDIATLLKPDEIISAAKSAGLKAIPTGIDHGTITLVVNGKAFEVTTLRKDVETDGRRAVVAFSDNWAEDAQRRDFTMNTLLMNANGEIFDPLGQGLEDLKARKVVFVGDPASRIAEDVLRILRFFRFHAYYGEGDPDQNALMACKAQADKIPDLSRERITQEFFKILSVNDVVGILDLMFENNVLKSFSEYGYNADFLSYVCKFQKDYTLRSISTRLFILAGMDGKNLTHFEELLLIPKLFKKDIQFLNQVLSLPDLSNEHAVKVAIYKYGRTPTAQALMVELAQDRVMNAYAPKALEVIQNWDIPIFPITGEDLIKKGIPQGPKLGEELERLENEWIARGFV